MRTSFWTALAALVAVTVRADTYRLEFHAETGTTFEDPWDGHLVVGPGWIWQPVNEGFPGLAVFANIYPPNAPPKRLRVSGSSLAFRSIPRANRLSVRDPGE